MLLYRLALALYALALRLAALWGNPKARLWLQGRKRWRQGLRTELRRTPGLRLVWLHCASLGEFEQGRTFIERFLDQNPDCEMVLSFFSPSGYQAAQGYARATAGIFYLPLDSPSNAKDWLQLLRPDLVFFVKYEFWYYTLQALHRQGIPTYLVSAVFRPNQVFFKWYGGLFRRCLGFFTHLFVQNTQSQTLLAGIGVRAVSVCGDTRLDRVVQRAKMPKDLPLIAQWAAAGRLWVLGSTWPPDEVLIIDYYKKYLQKSDFKLLVVPHEIDETHLQHIETLLQGLTHCRYSRFTPQSIPHIQAVIVDSIGLLAHLYAYAELAWIGGGFGRGIHNTLEAAVFGIPVLFGPRHHKFPEASRLIQLGMGFCIRNQAELNAFFQEYTPALRQTVRQNAARFVEDYGGATERILNKLKDL